MNGNGYAKSNGEKVTKRQAKLIKNIKAKKHKTLAEAAKDAGYAANTPHKSIERSVRSVLGKYLRALEKAGATDAKSARVISEAMDATTQKGVGYGDDFTIVEEVDHYARLKANDQYQKVKRLLGVEEAEDKLPPQIVVNVVTVTPAQNADNLQAPRFASPDIQ